MFDKEVVFFFLAGIGRNKQTGETKALAIYSPRKRKQALELAQGGMPYRNDYFQVIETENGEKSLFFPVVGENEELKAVYFFKPKEEVLKEAILNNLREEEGGIVRLPVLHKESRKGKLEGKIFEGLIPLYPEEVEAIKAFLEVKKRWEEVPQYSLPYDEKAINLPISGFLFLPGEGLVFFSFAENKELKEIEGKTAGEKKIKFGLSNSGGAVLKIPYEDGKPLSLGLPLFIPSILRALTTVSPTGSLKILLFPKEVRRELEKRGIGAIPDVLLNREQLTLIVEVPEILPLLCRLIVASELFETFEKTYIANSNRLLRKGKFLLN